MKKSLFKNHNRGFPGGAVVKNLPANAGDTGSSPGPGRSHIKKKKKMGKIIIDITVFLLLHMLIQNFE